MRTLAITIALAVATPAAAEAPSLLSYGLSPLTGHVTVQDHRFNIYVHPKADILLVQPAMAEMGHVPSKWPLEVWREAAVEFIKPLGCDISDISVHGGKAFGSWDAQYVCPPGVDLKAIAVSQRARLKSGEPLQRPDSLSGQ